MRVLVPYAQLAWRLGQGEPQDAQHASYLFDTDVFLTADRRYAWALELVRSWTKTSFARVALLQVGDPRVSSLLAGIRDALVQHGGRGRV